MNKIQLNGLIRNIQYSHNIKDIEYYKAELLVKRQSGVEDLINLKFKRFSCAYKDNENISLVGNVRTYSTKNADKSKVEVYVFTYMDKPETMSTNNIVELDGRICKSNGLRKTKLGKDVLDFILANNAVSENGQSLNCYIPCTAWGKQAKEIAQLQIGTFIEVKGELRSREYKKRISDNDFEIRIAHEVNIFELNK